MTSESDFQAALDADPTDRHTRLVFADWLQDRGDPRADGYRALGTLHRVPHFYSTTKEWGFDSERTSSQHDGDELPDDWFQLMKELNPKGTTWGQTVRVSPVRSVIEDSAALAFAELPAPRRAELAAIVGPLITDRNRRRAD